LTIDLNTTLLGKQIFGIPFIPLGIGQYSHCLLDKKRKGLYRLSFIDKAEPHSLLSGLHTVGKTRPYAFAPPSTN